MQRTVVTAVVALAVAAFASPGAAGASVVSGSVSDPVGDVHDVDGYVGMNDVVSYALSYNSDGRLDVTVRYAAFGRPADGIHSPHPDFWVYAALGRWNAGTGSCSAPALDGWGNAVPGSGGAFGDAIVAMYEGPAIPQVRAELVGYTGELRHDGLTYDTSRAAFSGSVEGAALARRGYDCATSIISNAHGTPDTVRSFCMSASGTVPCASSAPPSVSWVSPADGETVSGVFTEGGIQNCLARVTGTVTRTENFVDGRLHDVQLNAPWSCEWDTRDVPDGLHELTVKAFDADGNVVARDTIRVTVHNAGETDASGSAAPPPPDPDTPEPPSPKDEGFPSGDDMTPPPSAAGDPKGGEPTSSREPPPAAGLTPLTRLSARRAARNALRSRFGKRAYRIACVVAPSGHRSVCRASWGKRGRASVVVVRNRERDRIEVRRLARRRARS